MLLSVSVSIVSVVLNGICGLFGGALGTGVGLYVAIGGIKGLNRSWRILTTDSVPIDKAITTDELVQVSGSVRPSKSSDTILSPIQSEECVAYTYEINSQLNDNCSIDSGVDCRPFRISDGTTEILVDPTRESLSLETHKKTVTGGEEVSREIDEEKVNVDPSAEISDSGSIPNPIELIEGTIRIGEEIIIIGKASPTPTEVAEDTDIGATGDADANAIVTPETGHLDLRNDVSETTAPKAGIQGALALIFGSTFTLIGAGVFLTTLSSL